MKKSLEVFWRFLALGLVSFGGPAAHIGYFQKTFVQKLQGLDDAAYARLVALSQFLPGPASSQVGFAIGLQRAGIWGGVAAFVGFTLPSFGLMYLLLFSNGEQQSQPLIAGVVQGLKLLAVVVVADASLNLFRSFCQQRLAMAIAVFTAVILLWLPSLFTQMLLLLLAAALGALKGQGAATAAAGRGRFQRLPLLLFAVLFVSLPLLAGHSPWLALVADFYQSGSLVFGGGHVVLPLLQQTVGEAIATDRFLLGYAAAQAVPGPMFSLAAFLGAELAPAQPLLGAALATLAIFLPGFLLVLGLNSAWQSLTVRPRVAGAAWGINAAVVGLLLSALYQPVFVSAVNSAADMALVLVGFFVLRVLKLPIVLLVLGFAGLGLWQAW